MDISGITLVVADCKEASRWEKPGKKLYTYDVYQGTACLGQVKAEVRMHSQMSDNGRIRIRDFYGVEWNYCPAGGHWLTGWGYETRKEAVAALVRSFD
jgi:hypothetical protein